MRYHDEDRAEDLGYRSYRCPRCRRRFWDDSPPRECPHCGEGHEDEPDDKDEDDDDN